MPPRHRRIVLVPRSRLIPPVFFGLFRTLRHTVSLQADMLLRHFKCSARHGNMGGRAPILACSLLALLLSVSCGLEASKNATVESAEFATTLFPPFDSSEPEFQAQLAFARGLTRGIFLDNGACNSSGCHSLPEAAQLVC